MSSHRECLERGLWRPPHHQVALPDAAWQLRFCAPSSQRLNHLTTPSTLCRLKLPILSPSGSEAIDTFALIQNNPTMFACPTSAAAVSACPQSATLEVDVGLISK
ncbi:uncharacterized protein BDW70DRAFT_138027 [Aspergillus foveolatus]|uniref:uncharacterized protein n=1 Tax=Aspergillus foveolatus TaxID=210207 RepID=UPI003CCD9FD8